jgi:hypothetical protein
MTGLRLRLSKGFSKDSYFLPFQLMMGKDSASKTLRCLVSEYRTMDDVQKHGNSECEDRHQS